MKFIEAEYILGIQRLRSEVYTEDNKTLCVLGNDKLNAITRFIKDELKALGYRRRAFSVEHTGVYHKIILQGSYHFECNLEDDEIILVKGYDRINIFIEIGEPVSHDYDIDSNTIHALQMIENLKEGKLC